MSQQGCFDCMVKTLQKADLPGPLRHQLLVRKQYYLERLVRTFLILIVLVFYYKINLEFSKNETNSIFCSNSRILFIGCCFLEQISRMLLTCINL